MIIKALQFAAEKHRGQLRKGNLKTPYINHPIKVAFVLETIGKVTDQNVLAAALLHDVIEDTDATHKDLVNLFNTKVADIVIEISDEKGLDRKVRKRLQIQDAKNLSYEAKIIRIADKLCNIQDNCGIDAPNWDYDRKYEYLQWAEEVVNQIKGTHEELENSFFDEHRWGRLKL